MSRSGHPFVGVLVLFISKSHSYTLLFILAAVFALLASTLITRIKGAS